MVCKMKLNDSFWKHFELDLQEIKLVYMNWAIGYAREPKPEYQHLFLWDHQDCFCIINVTRYGEFLEEKYVLNLNRKLPGFSRNTRSTFLSSAFSWNRYGMCAFDCGPVLWSKKGRNRLNISYFTHYLKDIGHLIRDTEW